jgi:hypothetical protein
MRSPQRDAWRRAAGNQFKLNAFAVSIALLKVFPLLRAWTCRDRYAERGAGAF